MTPAEIATRKKLNLAVRALSKRDHEQAVAVLAKFGVIRTSELKAKQLPAVHAAFVEALAQLEDAPQQAAPLPEVGAAKGNEFTDALDAREIAIAMRNIGYRRQAHRGRWHVVWWPAGDVFPSLVNYSPAGRKSVLRKVSRKANLDEWQAITMRLPAVASFDEIKRANFGAGETHRLLDNQDLIRGDSDTAGES